MPDPKLMELGKQMRELMKKHDVTGLVILQSPAYMEYVCEVEASWCCCKWEKDDDGKTVGVRIQSNKNTEPDPVLRHRKLEDTVGMVYGTLDVLRKMQDQYFQLGLAIAKTGMEVEHRSLDEPRDQ